MAIPLPPENIGQALTPVGDHIIFMKPLDVHVEFCDRSDAAFDYEKEDMSEMRIRISRPVLIVDRHHTYKLFDYKGRTEDGLRLILSKCAIPNQGTSICTTDKLRDDPKVFWRGFWRGVFNWDYMYRGLHSLICKPCDNVCPPHRHRHLDARCQCCAGSCSCLHNCSCNHCVLECECEDWECRHQTAGEVATDILERFPSYSSPLMVPFTNAILEPREYLQELF